MGKKNIIVDSDYLIGNSRLVRRVRGFNDYNGNGWCGHPSLKLSYGQGASGDFFRGAAARYWGFREGTNENWYSEFGYLNKSKDLIDLSDWVLAFNGHNNEDAISFKLDTISAEERYQSTAGTAGSFAVAIEGNGGQNILGFLGYLSPTTMASSDTNLSMRTELLYVADEMTWVNASDNADPSVGTPLGRLEQFAGAPSNWPEYRDGGFGATATPAGQSFKGIMSDTISFFSDHAHTLVTPYSAHTPLLNSGAPVALKIAQIEPAYNYFMKSYEEETTNMTLPESVLPNAYILYNATEYAPTVTDSENILLSASMYDRYREVSTLGNQFAFPQTRDQIKNLGYVGNSQPGEPLYKKNFIHKYAITLANGTAGEAASLQQHIGFSQDLLETDFDRYGVETYFPFQIGIEFDTTHPFAYDESNKITTLMEEHAGSVDFMLQYLMMGSISGSFLHDEVVPTSFSAEIRDVAEGFKYKGFDWVPGGASGWGFSRPAGPWTNDGPFNLRTYDVAVDILADANTKISGYGLHSNDQYRGNESGLIGQTNTTGICTREVAGSTNRESVGIMVGQKALSTAATGDTVDQVFARAFCVDSQLSQENYERLLLGYEKVVRENARSYLDILRGDMAYSEIIAFKVEKYALPEGTDQLPAAAVPIQSFYFPNLSTRDRIKYIDTQVKFAKKYIYKVYAYNLVIGSTYRYLHNIADDPDMGLKFSVHQFPSVQIFETPYYTFDPVQVRDYPPVFPDVEVVPFRAVNNKIRFLLNTQDIKYAFEPEKYKINSSDIAKYAVQREFQNKKLPPDGPGGPIVFGSDDSEVEFEVYRITTAPTSYVDFQGDPLATIEGRIPDGQRTLSVAYDDKIEPNQKYYYTFRCTDYHGGLSIPSPIYKVELIDDNGRIFPAIEVYHLNGGVPAASTKNTVKDMKRFIQLGPSFAQALINVGSPLLNNTAGNPDNVPASPLLNTQANGVWTSGTGANLIEKTFKVRITSKHTGRKLDLNLTFREKPILNPYEQE